MLNVIERELSGRLCWRGALVPSMGMALGGELLTALKVYDELILNFDGVEFIDISLLTLLCTIRRQANDRGKDLRLEGLENAKIAPVVERFRNKGNRLCRTYCGDSCLFDTAN